MALFSCVATFTVHADLQPDYYAEPGLNPQHDYLNQNASEFIDPFSGTLQRQYIDLLIPGNGGLDIKIQRSYAHPQGGGLVAEWLPVSDGIFILESYLKQAVPVHKQIYKIVHRRLMIILCLYYQMVLKNYCSIINP